MRCKPLNNILSSSNIGADQNSPEPGIMRTKQQNQSRDRNEEMLVS
jgi:hypothetical protein